MYTGVYQRRFAGWIWVGLACLALALGLLSRAVFRKTTYVITDGNRVFTYESYTTDPAEVLAEAGIPLEADDAVTTDFDTAGASLTVRRGMRVSVNRHGQQITVSSNGETVGAMLTRLNMFPGESDVLSVDADAAVYDGMELYIREILEERQTYSAVIPHETVYCYSDALPEGMSEVLTPGRDGEILCTALVTYVNGAERSREKLSQNVTRNPVTEVVAVGTGLRQEGMPTGNVIIGEGTITLPTGELLTYSDTIQVRATGYTHTDAGCDMITSTGTTVRIGTVAVDPRYIPYGTRMFIVSNDGSYIYGISVAEDCGGAIKGDRVDLYFPTTRECFAFGRRNCTVYLLGSEE